MSELQFEKDESGKLEEVFSEIMAKHFSDLWDREVRFLYTWRRSVKKKEGQMVLAEARKLSSRDRDLFKYDFHIEVWEKWWTDATEKDRERLAYHELNHCKLKYDEDGELMADDYDRPILVIEYHDLVLGEFRDAVEKFGMSEKDKVIAGFYNDIGKVKRVRRA